MRRLLTSTLLIITLGLAALNLRLQDRGEFLTDRNVLLENQLRLRTSSERADSSGVEKRMPRSSGTPPQAPTPPATHLASFNSLGLAENGLSRPVVRQTTLNPDSGSSQGYVHDFWTIGQLRCFQAENFSDLGLSESQRLVLDSLTNSRDAVEVFRTMLKEIDDRYEQSMRQVLDQDQLMIYEARRSGSLKWGWKMD